MKKRPAASGPKVPSAKKIRGKPHSPPPPPSIEGIKITMEEFERLKKKCAPFGQVLPRGMVFQPSEEHLKAWRLALQVVQSEKEKGKVWQLVLTVIEALEDWLLYTGILGEAVYDGKTRYPLLKPLPTVAEYQELKNRHYNRRVAQLFDEMVGDINGVGDDLSILSAAAYDVEAFKRLTRYASYEYPTAPPSVGEAPRSTSFKPRVSLP